MYTGVWQWLSFTHAHTHMLLYLVRWDLRTYQLLRGSQRSLVSGSEWQVSWECLPTWQRGLGDWSTTCHTSHVLGTLEIIVEWLTVHMYANCSGQAITRHWVPRIHTLQYTETSARRLKKNTYILYKQTYRQHIQYILVVDEWSNADSYV